MVFGGHPVYKQYAQCAQYNINTGNFIAYIIILIYNHQTEDLSIIYLTFFCFIHIEINI